MKRGGWDDDDVDIDCGVVLVAMLGTGVAVAWSVGWALWSVIT
jgi:hypothetical protein